MRRQSGRRLIRFGMVVLFIPIFLVLVISVVFYAGRGRFREMALEEVNRRVGVEVRVEGIEMELWSHFPRVSLRLTEVDVSGSMDVPSGEPLLKAGQLYVVFNFIEMVLGKMVIRGLTIEDAYLGMLKDRKGEVNYGIFRGSGKSHPDTHFPMIRFKNVHFTFIDEQARQEYRFRADRSVAAVRTTGSVYDISMNGEFRSILIQPGESPVLGERDLELDMHLLVDETRLMFDLKRARIRIDGIQCDMAGTLEPEGSSRRIDLDISIAKCDFQQFSALLPEQYRSLFTDFRIGGSFNLDMKLEGSWHKGAMPRVSAGFYFWNGEITWLPGEMAFYDVLLRGTFDTGLSGRRQTYTLILDEFSTSGPAGCMSGRLELNDFIHPGIGLDLSAGVDLTALPGWILPDTVRHISGKMDMQLAITGTLDELRMPRPEDLIPATVKGHLRLSGCSLQLAHSPLDLKDMEGSFILRDNRLEANGFCGRTSSGDFRINGHFHNLIPFLMIPGKSLGVQARIEAGHIDLDELLQYQGRCDTVYRLNLSERLSLNLELDIDSLTLGNFTAGQIGGRLLLGGRRLEARDFRFNSMKGHILFDGLLLQEDNSGFLMTCDASLRDVDISRLFYEMGNFGQQALTYNHLRGSLNTDLTFASRMDASLRTAPGSVFTQADITIDRGELIGYEPLRAITPYLKNQDLGHVEFSTLQNRIVIRDRIIFIPEMEVNTNTLDMRISGTHDFSNRIDYHIRIRLSDLLSGGNETVPDEKFGFIEDDGEGRTQLFFHLTGDASDPLLRYDTRAVTEKLASDLKKEGFELKDLLRSEFGRDQPDGREEAVDSAASMTGRHFIIGWDELPDEKKAKDSQQGMHAPLRERTITGSDRHWIIEWEESLPDSTLTEPDSLRK
ncbi:MAG: hypothetical protein JW861_09140 [Bacteroidales bacterium]|nr:hypothetical protein [Bacteroidales bacterium]